MWLVLLAGLLFLGGGFSNVLGPDPNRAEAIPGCALGITMLAIWWCLRLEQNARLKFLLWLREHRDAVRNGNAAYEGKPVTLKTEVTHFRLAMSFLIISVKLHSRYYFVDDAANGPRRALFSLGSLLFGWWGLPWGPVFTIDALVTDLRGGKKESIGALLDKVTGHERPVVHLKRPAKTPVAVHAVWDRELDS